jgi:hypothetical protein
MSGKSTNSNGLTDLQKNFIYEYVKCLKPKTAAERAGYKGNDVTLSAVAYENLRKPRIKAEIDRFLRENAMDAVEVVSRLADQARSDMGDFADIVGAADIGDHPRSRLIKKFKKRITTNKHGDTFEDIELELYDAHAALVDIGKIHGLFTDRVAHTGSIETRLVILPSKDDDD